MQAGNHVCFDWGSGMSMASIMRRRTREQPSSWVILNFDKWNQLMIILSLSDPWGRIASSNENVAAHKNKQNPLKWSEKWRLKHFRFCICSLCVLLMSSPVESWVMELYSVHTQEGRLVQIADGSSPAGILSVCLDTQENWLYTVQKYWNGKALTSIAFLFSALSWLVLQLKP